ncbi:hypothetical protein ACTFIZ_008345 [Dictyostelium cf. discoideum]
MINKILVKLIIIIFCFQFLFAEEDLISTPPGYYNLTRHKRYPHITEYQSSQDTDLYYPDVCRNALRNMYFPISVQFTPKVFPGFNTSGFNNADITLSTLLATYNLLVVCVEGNFTVKNGGPYFLIHSLIILPGGRFQSEVGIKFHDGNDYPPHTGVFFPDLPKDPFGFFPGILVLDGTFSVVGKESIVYRADRISDSSIEVSPSFSGLGDDSSYKIIVFTELYPQGFYCAFSTDTQRNKFSLSNFGSSRCETILENDKIIRVLIVLEGVENQLPISTDILKGVETTKGSIYITGESNVYFKNCFFQNLGFTTNEPYNDTKLIFSPNDSNKVTDIIMGTNQRFRSSLYIEFSKSVTIDGCAFVENKQTRSPLVLFDSNVIISNSVVLSESGSNIIAQYGTESIQSSNNSYILKKIDMDSLGIDQNNNNNNNNMDYGNQGNGIYSLSPNINSNNDFFFGQQYAFNYYFISNNSLTSNQVNNNSSLLNFKPIELGVINSNFNPLNNSLNKYLLSINSDGNNLNTYFTVKGLTTSHAISVNLNNSALIFHDLKGEEGFKMDGNVERLDIIGSNINSKISNETIKELSTSTTNIFDSYIYSSSPPDIQPFKNQIYGSLITPYYYSNSSTLDQIRITSIFPNVPIQIVSGSLFNAIVHIQILSSSISIDDISCIFTSSVINRTTVQVNFSNGSCILPLTINKEDSFNLRVTLVNNKSPSSSLSSSSSNNYLYIFDFPKITVFNTYSYYSGWLMENSNSTKQISFEGNLFQNGCNQGDSNCTISQNSKYLTGLPKLNISNELNELFSNGITSINPNEKVTVSTKINSKINFYQIQLFFTHQPIDDQPTPLSIYIENQPVFLLEPIKSISGPTFNNFTFKFENKNSLDNINIAFSTRGDIYLTSMATYSSIVIESPTLPPTETPTETQTQTPTPTKTPTETGKPTETPTTQTPITQSVNSNDNLALKIALPICLSLALFIGIIIMICIFKKAQSKSKTKKDDDENEMVTVKENKSITVSQPPAVTEEKPPQINSKSEDQKLVERDQPFKDPILKIREHPSLKDIELSNEETKSQQYGSPNSISKLQFSKQYDYGSEEFPLQFNKQILEFNLNGRKCMNDEIINDSLIIHNKSETEYLVNIIFPQNIDTGYVQIFNESFELPPHCTTEVKFSLALTCTTKFFEFFAVSAEAQGCSKCHTFLSVHVESETSLKLDYKEIKTEQLIASHHPSKVYVFKGYYRDLAVAVKKFPISDDNPESFEKIKNEAQILSKVNNIHVVRYIGSAQNSSHISIVTEYAKEGSLGSLIHDSKIKFSFIQKVKFMLDAAKGFTFLHANEIIHGDIKPDNFLVFSKEINEPCVKICDFGNSQELSEKESKSNLDSTMNYLSNEVFDGEGYQKSADVYAFGISLYEVMVEKVPFVEICYNDIPNRVQDGFRPTVGLDTIDSDIRKIIECCWIKEKSKRPSFSEISLHLENKFLKLLDQMNELEESTLNYNVKLETKEDTIDEN